MNEHVLDRWQVWKLCCRLGTNPHPDLTHPHDRRMIEMYASGMGTRAIGKELSLAASTVQQHLRKCGVRIRARREVQLDLDDAIQMYRAGNSARAIGDKYGMSYVTVAKRLKAAGITMRKGGQYDRHKAKR